jgi:hypothetical protein
VNEQPGLIEPLRTVHITPVAPKLEGVLESVTYESDELNPLPDTTTAVPRGPDVGLSEIPTTVKGVEAASETTLPVAMTL